MPPELAMSAPDLDRRADIYGLGCVAYWLLTGSLVFEEPSTMATIMAHLQKPPVPPSERTEIGIPGELEQIVLDCLAKDPAARPRSADELAARLRRCIDTGGWSRSHAERWWDLHMPAATPSVQAARMV